MSLQWPIFSVLFYLICITPICSQPTSLLADWGIEIGIFDRGELNGITDVNGVSVGHETLIVGDHIRTGVTAILPHDGNVFQDKVPAAIYIANGFGKLAGYSQVEELGYIESPILLTNTLSVSTAIEGGIRYSLDQPDNEGVRSVNIVVGETNDGKLNDIRGLHVKVDHVKSAIENARTTNIAQGNVGAGTGTVAFGFKGGIGMSSRTLPKSLGGYTVGVLVQSNFGGVLEIAGAPVGKEMDQYSFNSTLKNSDGSCMIVVATDAPLLARNLKRLAKRAILGFGKTGGMSSNGSGDYVIAFSTAKELRYSYRSETPTIEVSVLRNDRMSALFQATIEATEEAIINSILFADDMTGNRGLTVKAIDKVQVKSILEEYGRIKN